MICLIIDILNKGKILVFDELEENILGQGILVWKIEILTQFFEYINSYYCRITMVSYKSVAKQLKLLGINLVLAASGAFYQRSLFDVKSNYKTKRKRIPSDLLTSYFQMIKLDSPSTITNHFWNLAPSNVFLWISQFINLFLLHILQFSQIIH